MNDTEARELIATVLGRIAPEVPLDEVEPDADLREEMDLDSMDFLNYVTGLHERTGLDIPETDYPELATVDAAVAYLTKHTA